MLSPLTYTVELAGYVFGGEAFFGPLTNVTILAGYAALFLFVGVRFHIIYQRRQ
jgi:hypothetical protein